MLSLPCFNVGVCAGMTMHCTVPLYLKVVCSFERAVVSRDGITPSHYVLHSKPICVNSPTIFADFDDALFSDSVTFRDLGDHIFFPTLTLILLVSSPTLHCLADITPEARKDLSI